MKEYFVITDIHSFFTEMMDALKKSGFEMENPNHIIISCGDLFDRGYESKKLLDFLCEMQNSNRLISVRGNHDELMMTMLFRNYFGVHDYSNGTVQTFNDLSIDPHAYEKHFIDRIDKRWFDLYNAQKFYHETDHYIFVHGWIPFSESQGKVLYDPEWRNADESIWKMNALWENGMDAWKNGVREPNKTIVCGHWHCSYGWSHIRRKYKEFPQRTHEDFKYSFEPFIDDGIIALDACTAYSKKVNVLHLKENEL